MKSRLNMRYANRRRLETHLPYLDHGSGADLRLCLGGHTRPRVLSLAEDISLRIEPAPEQEVRRFNRRHRENQILSGELPGGRSSALQGVHR